MIQSGRLSIRAGTIARRIGLKPIVTLDANGKGSLESIAFSLTGSNKKIINHIKHILRKNRIEQYNIVYVNNETDANKLAHLLTHIIGLKPEYIMETSSIIAISAGEGRVAVSYLLVKEK